MLNLGLHCVLLKLVKIAVCPEKKKYRLKSSSVTLCAGFAPMQLTLKCKLLCFKQAQPTYNAEL